MYLPNVIILEILVKLETSVFDRYRYCVHDRLWKIMRELLMKSILVPPFAGERDCLADQNTDWPSIWNMSYYKDIIVEKKPKETQR